MVKILMMLLKPEKRGGKERGWTLLHPWWLRQIPTWIIYPFFLTPLANILKNLLVHGHTAWWWSSFPSPTRLWAPWRQGPHFAYVPVCPRYVYYTLTLWVFDKRWLNWINKVATRSRPRVLWCFRQLGLACYPLVWTPTAGNSFWLVTWACCFKLQNFRQDSAIRKPYDLVSECNCGS